MHRSASDRYRAVVFDFDDTLVVTREIKWAHHQEVAKSYYGINLTEGELRAHWGKPFDVLISTLYKESDCISNMRAANRSLEHKYLKREQPSSKNVVQSLIDEGVEVGIVSSDASRHLMQDLNRLGFPVNQMFHIQGADDTEYHKPHPSVFNPLKAKLEAYGIKASETLYVGDALIDFDAAREAGLGFLGVTTGLVSKHQFEAHGAHALLNLHELMPLVLRDTEALAVAMV
jgi:phosphoglycolate phosphatase